MEFKMKAVGNMLGNNYKGPSGNMYHFDRNNYTKVYDKMDIDYFSKDDRVEKKPGLIEEIVAKVTKKEKVKIYTKDELFDMNKDLQVDILSGFGIKKIPRLEKDRVALILELQEKNNKEE